MTNSTFYFWVDGRGTERSYEDGFAPNWRITNPLNFPGGVDNGAVFTR